MYSMHGPKRTTHCAPLRDWKNLNIYFVETPLRMDNLAGYAKLHQEDADADCCGRMADDTV